jgi:hypothetical protein
MVRGEIPKFKPRSGTFNKLRWWLFPLIFTMLSWAILLQPSLIEDHYHDHSFFSAKWFEKDIVNRYLPIVPKNLTEAYHFGYILAKVNITQDESHLDEIKEITGRPEVTMTEASLILKEIEAMVNHQSIFQKVWGFFTFVNIVWMGAIIGLLISTVPCLLLVFGPCLKRIIAKFAEVITKILKFILEKILIPTVTFMHNWGIIELMLYLTSF